MMSITQVTPGFSIKEVIMDVLAKGMAILQADEFSMEAFEHLNKVILTLLEKEDCNQIMQINN